MTLGEIRFQLLQRHPGISLDIIDRAVINRYQEILDALPWSRLDQEQAIVSTVEYATGTVDVSNGGTAITGTGTTWDATMDGRIIRIAASAEFYSFTFVDATSGTLDRGYEGDTDTELAYRINKNLFTLDSNVRKVNGVRLATGKLEYISPEELRALSPGRNSYGTPTRWTWAMDAESDPPQLQVELWPVPTEAETVYFSVTLDADGLEHGVTSTSMLPWTRPACLLAGCNAELYEVAGKLAQQDRAEARFGKLLSDMKRIECDRIGPARLRFSDHYTRHQTPTNDGYKHFQR